MKSGCKMLIQWFPAYIEEAQMVLEGKMSRSQPGLSRFWSLLVLLGHLILRVSLKFCGCILPISEPEVSSQSQCKIN